MEDERESSLSSGSELSESGAGSCDESDRGDSDKLQATVAEMTDRITANAYDLRAYVRLTSALRQLIKLEGGNSGMWEQTLWIRWSEMLRLFVLDSNEWKCIAERLFNSSDGGDIGNGALSQLQSVVARIRRDGFMPSVLVQYLSLKIAASMSGSDGDNPRSHLETGEFEDALVCCDFVHTEALFALYRRAFPDRANELTVRQLRVPHLTIEATYARLAPTAGEGGTEEGRLRRLFEQTVAVVEALMPHEERVLTGGPYNHYIEASLHGKLKTVISPASVVQLYERALQRAYDELIQQLRQEEEAREGVAIEESKLQKEQQGQLQDQIQHMVKQVEYWLKELIAYVTGALGDCRLLQTIAQRGVRMLQPFQVSVAWLYVRWMQSLEGVDQGDWPADQAGENQEPGLMRIYRAACSSITDWQEALSLTMEFMHSCRRSSLLDDEAKQRAFDLAGAFLQNYGGLSEQAEMYRSSVFASEFHARWEGILQRNPTESYYYLECINRLQSDGSSSSSSSSSDGIKESNSEERQFRRIIALFKRAINSCPDKQVIADEYRRFVEKAPRATLSDVWAMEAFVGRAIQPIASNEKAGATALTERDKKGKGKGKGKEKDKEEKEKEKEKKEEKEKEKEKKESKAAKRPSDALVDSTVQQDKKRKTTCTVFVSNLAYSATEADIAGFFEGNGITVDQVRLVRDGSRSKGYGYVDVADEDRALLLDRSLLGGRMLYVSKSVDKRRPVSAAPQKTSSVAVPRQVRHKKRLATTTTASADAAKESATGDKEESAAAALSNSDFRKMLFGPK